MVGARSALFLPFADLGLIVVDEEHEGAYKQEDGVIYNARDMAVVRARLERAPVVLASATPALETRVNAETGRYRWLRLPSRFGAATPARHRDRRPQARGPAARALAVAEGDRGRRGGARARRAGAALPQPARLCAPHALPRLRASVRMPQLLRVAGRAPLPRRARLPPLRPCRSAAETLPGMPRGRQPRPPAGRASSGSPRRPRFCFPTSARSSLSSDFPGGIETLRRQLDAAARGEYDLIIGTQLVAKGHNFPLLTFVCVVDADVGLANADPRAAERTFQLLRQATGRAGRGERDRTRAAADLAAGASGHRRARLGRRRAILPRRDRAAARRRPAAVRAARGDHRLGRRPGRGGGACPRARAGRARPARRARAGGSRRSAASRSADEIVLLGPAEAPIAVLRKRHRFRLAVKAPRSADLQGFLRAMLAAAPSPRGGVRVAIDVDPQSFL